MNRKIFNYFEIAGQTASRRDDERSFLIGAVGIRNDGAMVKAVNGPTHVPTRTTHAEKRLCSRLDFGATVYVARVRMLDGQFAMSRPCHNCLKALISRHVSRVYYTIGPAEFGRIDLPSLAEITKKI